MEILNEFTNWVIKNYSHTKGGYRHRGDFYKNDKPVNLQALKDRFINEKKIIEKLERNTSEARLPLGDVVKKVKIGGVTAFPNCDHDILNVKDFTNPLDSLLRQIKKEIGLE